MKCNVCSKKIEETFLNKIVGTVIKDKERKKSYYICPECQKKFPKKEDLLTNLK